MPAAILRLRRRGRQGFSCAMLTARHNAFGAYRTGHKAV